ncbi:hypothetical protein [Daeguia caeni]
MKDGCTNLKPMQPLSIPYTGLMRRGLFRHVCADLPDQIRHGLAELRFINALFPCRVSKLHFQAHHRSMPFLPTISAASAAILLSGAGTMVRHLGLNFHGLSVNIAFLLATGQNTQLISGHRLHHCHLLWHGCQTMTALVVATIIPTVIKSIS